MWNDARRQAGYRERSTMARIGALSLVAFIAITAFSSPVEGQPLQRPDPKRFEQEVQQLEGATKSSRRVEVLFVGSSSIRLWNLKKSFPDLDALNRGFGGSHLADCSHFAPRLVHPFHPRVVVLYAGDNDIAYGLSPVQVAEDFDQFYDDLRKVLPATRLIYISIKPSLARWQLYPQMKAANEKIRARMGSDERACFLDVAPAMLGEDGQPRPELFLEDGLHLNARGYALWTTMLQPVMERALDALPR